MSYSLGIDIGYSSIKLALIDSSFEIKYTQYLLHKGSIKQALARCLEELGLVYDLKEIKMGAVTGSVSKLLSSNPEIVFINEVTAIVEGSLSICNPIGSIIEIGGQSAKYIIFLQ